MEDQQIISRIVKGDSKSFGILVERYQDLAYTIAIQILKCPDAAADAAQESFIKAYNKLDKFKGQSKFSSWLYTIVYRTSLTQLKKSNKYAGFDDMEQQVSFNSDSSDSDYRDQQVHDLKKAIACLSPLDQSIISMFYTAEMSLKEIEEATELSQANIKVRLHRSRKKLAELMQEVSNYEEAR